MKTFKILESFYVPCDPIEDYEDLQNETSIENDQYSRKFLRRDQVNLLVYVPCDPILSKNKKMILQNFGQLAFF